MGPEFHEHTPRDVHAGQHSDTPNAAKVHFPEFMFTIIHIRPANKASIEGQVHGIFAPAAVDGGNQRISVQKSQLR